MILMVVFASNRYALLSAYILKFSSHLSSIGAVFSNVLHSDLVISTISVCLLNF